MDLEVTLVGDLVMEAHEVGPEEAVAEAGVACQTVSPVVPVVVADPTTRDVAATITAIEGIVDEVCIGDRSTIPHA